MEKNSTFNALYSLDVNAKTEKKNGLTYLSWAWAWAEVKKHAPDANYEVVLWDNKPYLFNADLGYLVATKVTINGEIIGMQLPVMDGANKAQKNLPYTYKTKFGEKVVEAATMFDINTAIMRCLTKNLAMFGLGLYIYAGEDLPESQDAQKPTTSEAVVSEGKQWITEEKFAMLCEQVKNGDTDAIRRAKQKVKINLQQLATLDTYTK
jgi:uncharacterized protein YgbK (DUF1537 family)